MLEILEQCLVVTQISRLLTCYVFSVFERKYMAQHSDQFLTSTFLIKKHLDWNVNE